MLLTSPVLLLALAIVTAIGYCMLLVSISIAFGLGGIPGFAPIILDFDEAIVATAGLELSWL